MPAMPQGAKISSTMTSMPKMACTNCGLWSTSTLRSRPVVSPACAVRPVMMEGSSSQTAAPITAPGSEPMPPMMIMAMNWMAN